MILTKSSGKPHLDQGLTWWLIWDVTNMKENEIMDG
jgi:hypothetical protein